MRLLTDRDQAYVVIEGCEDDNTGTTNKVSINQPFEEDFIQQRRYYIIETETSI
jgi:hypothetical protein